MKLTRSAMALTAKVFFISWFGALTLRYSGIIEHPTVDFLTFALFGAFALPFVLLGFLVPLTSAVRGVADGAPYEGNVDACGQVYVLARLLSIVYLALVFVDKVLLGDALTVGVTEARYAAMAEGVRNSSLGAIHYFLAGAPAILLCLLLSRRASGRKTSFFSWFLVISGFCFFFLSGGRNSFVVGVIFVFFYFLLERMRFYKSSARKRIRYPAWMMIFALLGVVYVLYLFVERAEIRGTDLEGAMQSLSRNYDVNVFHPPWLTGFALQIYYSLAYLVFYLTHAPTYVSQYMSNDYSPMLMGGYSFHILFRIFDVIVGTHFAADSFDRLLISGVYLTLPGTIYVDFGWTGVVFSAVLVAGFTVFFVSKALSSKSGSGVMAASLCLTIVALSPFYSGLSVGNGFSLLVLLPALKLFSRVLKIHP